MTSSITTETEPETVALALGDGGTMTFARRVHAAFVRFRALFARSLALTILFKAVVAIVGGIVILAGVLMLVLPGPGWLTIFLGLAILGIEFQWARRVLSWLRMKVHAVADRWRRWRAANKARKNTSGIQPEG